MIFKNKSELQIAIIVIRYSLLFAIIGLLLLSVFQPLFVILMGMVSLLYLGMTMIEKNYDVIILKIQNCTKNIIFYKIFETYSFLSIISFILLVFNGFMVLFLFLFISTLHPWLKILAFLIMGSSLYFGLVFGFASLFNKVKNRFFGTIAFIGHLGFLFVSGFFIMRAFFELLSLMFFGVRVYDDNVYS